MSDALFARLAKDLAAKRSDRLLALADAVRARLAQFPRQLDILEDASRPGAHLSVLAPRQVGKTTALLGLVLDFAFRNPGANILYITLVRDVAERNFWFPLLRWNEEMDLGLDKGLMHASHTCWFSNGSRLTLRGAEAFNDVEKFRGEPRDLVIVDEAKSFSKDLFDYMLKESITPSLAARNGRLIIAGTPGDILAGPFYDTAPEAGAMDIVDGFATSRPYQERNDPKWAGVRFAWSFHSWSLADAAASGIPELVNVAKGAHEAKARYGWSDQHPSWLREWCARWISDASRLVYRYRPDRNDWTPNQTAKNPLGLPEGHVWHFVIGADFGATNPFALVMFAYAMTHPDAYQVYEFEQAGMIIPQMLAVVNAARDMVGHERVIAMVGDFDNLGAAIQGTLAADGAYFHKAEKKDKRSFIELYNADLTERRIYILKGSKLGQQMLYLAWDDTGLKEKSGQRNDLCDGAIYAIRWLKHRDATVPVTGPEMGTPAYIDAQMREAEDRHVKKRIAERRREQYLNRPKWGDGDY